jgi:hypothetical protein
MSDLKQNGLTASEEMLARTFDAWRKEFRGILENHRREIQDRLEKIEREIEKKSDKEKICGFDDDVANDTIHKNKTSRLVGCADAFHSGSRIHPDNLSGFVCQAYLFSSFSGINQDFLCPIQSPDMHFFSAFGGIYAQPTRREVLFLWMVSLATSSSNPQIKY